MENPLIEQSIDFAVDMVGYYRWLCQERKEFVMSKQVLRSGTSIGANIHEANFAISKADFISKMQIALKEAHETQYWLTVLERTGYVRAEDKKLRQNCESLMKMLIATLNTSKQ